MLQYRFFKTILRRITYYRLLLNVRILFRQWKISFSDPSIKVTEGNKLYKLRGATSGGCKKQIRILYGTDTMGQECSRVMVIKYSA